MQTRCGNGILCPEDSRWSVLPAEMREEDGRAGALQIMEELVYDADGLGFILQEIRSFRILNKVT